MPKMTIDELKKMRESAKKDIYLREGKFRGKVNVHMGTCGIAAGAREIMNAFLEERENKEISDLLFTSTGCAGLCSEEPMVTVEMEGAAPIKYGKITPAIAKKIFHEHLVIGNVVKENVIGIGSEKAG